MFVSSQKAPFTEKQHFISKVDFERISITPLSPAIIAAAAVQR